MHMPGFKESQIPVNFGPPPPDRTRSPEDLEAELERKTAEARTAIGKITSRKDLDELHQVIPEGDVRPNVTVFRLPQDPDDMYKPEKLFEVIFNGAGKAVKAHELEPQKQSFDDVVKRGRRAV